MNAQSKILLNAEVFRKIGKLGKPEPEEKKVRAKKEEKKTKRVSPPKPANLKKVSHQIKIHKGIRRMDLVRKSKLSTFCIDKCIKKLVADNLVCLKLIGVSGKNPINEYWWVGE